MIRFPISMNFARDVPSAIILAGFLTFMFDFGSLVTGINTPSTQFYALSLGASATVVGLLFSLANVISAVVRIPAGFIMDRNGLKRLMTYSFLGSAVALVIALLANRWELLAVAMLGTGMSGGTHWASQKYRMSRSTNTTNRSLAFSLLFFGASSAGLVGSTISGIFIQNYGFSLPLICGIFIIFVGSILSLKLPQIESQNNERVKKKFGNIISDLRGMHRTVWLITLFKTSFNSIVGLTVVVYPLFLRDFFGLDFVTVGLILTLIAIVRLTGLLSAGRMKSTSGRINILLGASILVPLFFSFMFIVDLFVAVAVLCIIAFLTSQITPTMDAIMADSAKTTQIGLSFGIMDTLMRIGIAGGNIIGGLVIDQFGFIISLSTAGIIAIVPTLFALMIRRNIKRSLERT